MTKTTKYSSWVVQTHVKQTKMADGHLLQTAKSQYLSNGLTNHWEMWHDDVTTVDQCTLYILPLHTPHLLFYVIKPQILQKQKLASDSLLYKSRCFKANIKILSANYKRRS